MSSIADKLTAQLGPELVLRDDATLRACRRDAWVVSELDDLEGAPVPLPTCVVRPHSVEHVAAVVRACAETGTALVPSGLRSGVCGGVLAGAESVVLDMSSLARVRGIDSHNLIGSFDAGVRGSDAEARANAEGLTLGHFPQSIAISSVGGWVATRAAGQFSTGYGNIEDLLLGVEAILPDGSLLSSSPTPRAAIGPDLRQLLLGSEGTLGVITGVKLALRRLPEARRCAAYYVKNMASGFEAQRAILQAGWSPVVLRQYDAREVARLFAPYRRNSDALLLVVHEGPREKVEAETEAVRRQLLSGGAEDAAATATEHWLEEHNKVPTFKSFLESRVIVDTLEVAAPYTHIGPLYDAAVKRLGAVPGIWNGSAHSSHAYRTGLNLYFSFAVQPKDKARLRAAYHECWSAVMESCLEHQGTIAHHHGIGRVRREWLARELGSTGLATLRALKHALDPLGIFNPGVLLPDVSG
jgi:alkyldihydroxyacetonephosphate synthase